MDSTLGPAPPRPETAVSGGGEAAPFADDDTLLIALRRHDPAAFEVLVRHHGPRLMAVVRRYLRNEEDARDALQETFLMAFRGIDGFGGQSKLETWLHRIAVNAALMRLRSRSRRPEDSIEDLLPQFDETGHQRNATRWKPALPESERAEVCALVRLAIDTLPESYRTVLLLRDIDNLDTDEAATVLGITPNAVKIRLHRARQALRARLDSRLREALL